MTHTNDKDALQDQLGPAAGAPGVQGAALPAGAQGRSPASLDQLAITVTEDTAKGLPAISAWAVPGRARMAARYARIAEERDSSWHRSRSLSLGISLAERVKGCESESITLENPTSGETVEKKVECRQRLCPPCVEKRARRTAGRLVAAFKAMDQYQYKRGRRKVMITLTVRHSGSASLDAKRLQDAWANLRSSYYSRQKSRAIAATGDKNAKPRTPGFAFVRVLELAGGTQRTGHAHLHVVAYLPTWNNYEWWQKAWRNALQSADGHLTESGEIVLPANCYGSGNVDFATVTDRNSMKTAHYVSKVANYVGKAGTDLEQLEPRAAGEFLGEFVGRRWLTTSRGFWPIVVDRPREWVIASMPEGKDRRHLKDWWTKLKPPQTG